MSGCMSNPNGLYVMLVTICAMLTLYNMSATSARSQGRAIDSGELAQSRVVHLLQEQSQQLSLLTALLENHTKIDIATLAALQDLVVHPRSVIQSQRSELQNKKVRFQTEEQRTEIPQTKGQANGLNQQRKPVVTTQAIPVSTDDVMGNLTRFIPFGTFPATVISVGCGNCLQLARLRRGLPKAQVYLIGCQLPALACKNATLPQYSKVDLVVSSFPTGQPLAEHFEALRSLLRYCGTVVISVLHSPVTANVTAVLGKRYGDAFQVVRHERPGVTRWLQLAYTRPAALPPVAPGSKPVPALPRRYVWMCKFANSSAYWPRVTERANSNPCPLVE
eukprot:TRINITY_DN99119_c0_g1_i1.p1 TRINITY_DN99119_c0_g1~~TRINITY_DN99119_c0_g1_i1.p1  ORF type:complete len:334 (+),score=37.62 TRINITY_DN99119_c0_g1_i1:33-1034(+)